MIFVATVLPLVCADSVPAVPASSITPVIAVFTALLPPLLFSMPSAMALIILSPTPENFSELLPPKPNQPVLCMPSASLMADSSASVILPTPPEKSSADTSPMPALIPFTRFSPNACVLVLAPSVVPNSAAIASSAALAAFLPAFSTSSLPLSIPPFTPDIMSEPISLPSLDSDD